MRVTFQDTYKEFAHGTMLIRKMAYRKEIKKSSMVAKVAGAALLVLCALALGRAAYTGLLTLPSEGVWNALTQLSSTGFMLAVLVVIGVGQWVAARFFYTRILWRQSPVAQGEQHAEIQEQGMTFGNLSYTASINWTGIGVVGMDGRVVVIGTPLGHYIIPIRCFESPEAAKQFRDVLASYIDNKPRGFPVDAAEEKQPDSHD